MRKLLSLLILFVFALSAKADNAPGIKVLLEDGTSHLFLLEDNPVAKFKGGVLVITSKKQEISVNLDEGALVQVAYVNENDGIREMGDGQQFVYRITDYGMDANGLRPNTMVYVYDLTGAVVAKATVGQDGSMRVPLNGHGVFIVRTSSSSIKIKK